jgi:lipooligosaccharide transport system permease protein
VAEAIARVTPLWHGVTLSRDLMLGSADVSGALGHVAYLVAFVVVGWWWTVRSFSSRLTA